MWGIFTFAKLSLGGVGDFIFRGRCVKIEVEIVIEVKEEIVVNVEVKESVTRSEEGYVNKKTKSAYARTEGTLAH